ncbi:MAG: hypothetical protein PUC73_05235 [Lachnospiraceae bacterium]|nr:hypothetical protein [Lachnospiraceae bacterium]
MNNIKPKEDEIFAYLENKEFIANTYVMRCFFVLMIVCTSAFLLNITGFFVIEQSLMCKA